MINKFGILGYFPFLFLSQHFTFLTIKAHIGRSCNAQFQLWFDSFHPLTGSHCGEVFVCFPRKLSSRVKRAARKGPLHPPIQAKAGKVFKWNKSSKYINWACTFVTSVSFHDTSSRAWTSIFGKFGKRKKPTFILHFVTVKWLMVTTDAAMFIHCGFWVHVITKLDIMMCKNGLIYAGFCVTHRKCRYIPQKEKGFRDL